MEPRVLLRALCPTRPGALRRARRGRAVLGGAGAAPSLPVPRHRPAQPMAPSDHSGAPAGPETLPSDRRGEGIAGVAGDLLTSGERVLVAVADVPRRAAGLEAMVAGLARWADGGRLLGEPRGPAGACRRLRPPGGARPPARAAGRIRCWERRRGRIWHGARPRPSSRSRSRGRSSTCARRSRRPTARCGSCREPRAGRARERPARRQSLPTQPAGLRAPGPSAGGAGPDRARPGRARLRAAPAGRTELARSAELPDCRGATTAIERALAPELPQRERAARAA